MYDFWSWQIPIIAGSNLASASNNSSSPKDPTKTSSSPAVLVSTLVPVSIIAGLQLLVFLFLRRTEPHIYAPRSILDTLDEFQKTPSSGKNGWFDWVKPFLRLKDEDLLEKQSLDAYLFLRFLKMILLICLAGLALTWSILLPVNVTGGGHSKGLDRFTIGNVQDPNRYFAHLLVSCVFLAFVMFTITRETLFLITLRQAYLLTPWNASRISSRTILLTSVPKRQLDESYLRQVLESVKRIWIIRDCTEAQKLANKQGEYAKSLEGSLVEYVQKDTKGKTGAPSQRNESLSKRTGERPTVRSSYLIGKSVDAIKFYSEQLLEMKGRAAESRDSILDGDATATGAVFVEFDTVSAAQSAIQSTSSQAPFVMIPRTVATVPNAIVWENISIPEWETVLRGLLTAAFVVALTLFWTIPTSFIGALSNISSIAEKVRWLHWINKLPRPALSTIEGLLPSLLLSTLVSYVPIIFRYMAFLSGEVTTAQVELKTQKWHFIFQVIQVFFVTTFASGATAVATDLINDPKQAPELLAKKLPKASNFYLSYFIIYGFGQSTQNLMNWSGLVFNKIFGLLDKTPREKFERYIGLSGTSWGSWYPKFTNLAIIAISYSTIAPLTLGFATVAFLFLYLVFRYNFFYVLDTSIDTQGRAYALALQQLTVGIYTAELCLIGLFSLSAQRKGGSTGPLIIMFIFTVLTVVYHRIMQRELGSMTKTLPTNIVREQEARGENASEHDQLLGTHQQSSDSSTGLSSLFLKFFAPQKYASFRSMMGMLERTKLGEAVPSMPKEKEESAYEHPALKPSIRRLWIPKDEHGISRKLIEELTDVIEVTDDGAWVDQTAKVNFDRKRLKDAPVFQQKLYF